MEVVVNRRDSHLIISQTSILLFLAYDGGEVATSRRFGAVIVFQGKTRICRARPSLWNEP
jgi:hypothetical protein